MYEKIDVKTVLIEITNRCNLRCVHCFNYFERDDYSTLYMSLDNIKYIIEKCKLYSLNKIFLSGGEPLLHPDIIKVIELCGEYPDIFFTITTNGLLLTQQLIIEIEKYTNVCVQLSVDGLEKSSYEAQRGKGTYDLFMKSLQMLISSKIKYITARTCVTKLNFREVGKIYRYLLDNNIMPSFLFANQMGNAEKNWDILHLTMANKITVLNEINKLNKEYKQTVSPPEAVATCNFTENAEVKSLLIKFNGNVAPCQFFYEKNIGNIFDNDISEILNYHNMEEYYVLANERKARLARDNSNCKKCKIQSICGYGCLGLANIMGGELDGECEYRLIMCAMYSNGMIERPNKLKESEELI